LPEVTSQAENLPTSIESLVVRGLTKLPHSRFVVGVMGLTEWCLRLYLEPLENSCERVMQNDVTITVL